MSIAAAVLALTGAESTDVQPLAGGTNNVVARVVADGRPLLAKLYFAHPDDPRDRLEIEFAVLSFLWRHGVRCVPEPVAIDRMHNVGLYEFVEGAPVEPGGITWTDVAQLMDLLDAMWTLRTTSDAHLLADASQAAFTIRDALGNVERRLARARAAVAEDETAARTYVQLELSRTAERVLAWVEGAAAARGVDLDANLSAADRTLSPADHGFHNALRRPDGRLVFLDFEYAGWDDPARMLANACLHPGVPFPGDLSGRFLREMLERLNGGRELADRLRLVYPLTALEWSLIMLNEFLPVAAQRRSFAGAGGGERRDAQLEKSRAQLAVAEGSMQSTSFLEQLVRP